MEAVADMVVTEFSRLQNWLLAIKDKDIATYNSMHDWYIE